MNRTLPTAEDIYLKYHFDLKPFCGKDMYLTSEIDKLTIYKVLDERYNRRAITISVPRFEKKHPERLVATEYNMFAVFEYTKVKEYTSEEIDWYKFNTEFVNAFNKLLNE